jgi:hypothetical protein
MTTIKDLTLVAVNIRGQPNSLHVVRKLKIRMALSPGAARGRTTLTMA